MTVTAPNTPAIADAIAAYLQALVYPNSSPVYDYVQVEGIKDITDYITNNQACAEVYGNDDDSQHHAFNGVVCDDQSWYILSLCSLDTPQQARQIYAIRDALVQPFQQHATLGDVGSVYQAQIKENSGKFLRVYRNGIECRAHLIEITTKQLWQVPYPGVVS